MTRCLLSLPPEVLALVFSELPNRDCKSLRLTCSTLRHATQLRLNRVFLSPNRRDLTVFLEVLEDERFKQQITEIVWDDSVFLKDPADMVSTEVTTVPHEEMKLLEWYQLNCEAAEGRMQTRVRFFRDSRAPLVQAQKEVENPVKRPLGDNCWRYRKLHHCQNKILKASEDMSLLRQGLVGFPNLKKITISHAVHGWLGEPFYETPLIRTRPTSFSYPIPRSRVQTAGFRRWGTVDQSWHDLTEPNKDVFRGFTGIMKALASVKAEDCTLAELVMETNGLPAGLTAHFFGETSKEYDDFAAVLSRPEFRRLDLCLTADGQEQNNWQGFRSGLLRDALGNARDLEHFSLHTDFDVSVINHGLSTIDESLDHWVPLAQFLPVDCWSQLRHFGLSRFMVKQSDLISFLEALPKTIRSVELKSLTFVTGCGSYAGVLDDVREKLRFHQREVKPKLVIAVRPNPSAPPGIAVWIESEIHHFLYNVGPNPFRGCKGPYRVDLGTGVERDTFNPRYERPYTSDFDWAAETRQLNVRIGRLRRELAAARGKLWMGVELHRKQVEDDDNFRAQMQLELDPLGELDYSSAEEVGFEN